MNPYSMSLEELKRAAFSQSEPEKPKAVQEIDSAWEEFTRLCPDYGDSPQNAEILARCVDTARVFPSAHVFQVAHAMAIYAGEYGPREQPLDGNPETMPLAELERLKDGFPQRPEPEPSLQELHEQEFG